MFYFLSLSSIQTDFQGMLLGAWTARAGKHSFLNA